jgi:hypothetical protein
MKEILGGLMRVQAEVMRKKSTIYTTGSNNAGFSMSCSGLIEPAASVPSFSYLPIEYSRLLTSPKEGFAVATDSAIASEKAGKTTVPARAVCFAEIMSEILISLVNSSEYKRKRDHSYPDSFYAKSIELFEKKSENIVEDYDLCIIHAKQLMITLRSCKLVPSTDSSIMSSSESLYKIIFDSFWNHTSWGSLFPSMPDTAVAMQDDRYLLIELLISRKGTFFVDDIARDYFSGLEYPVKQMLLYISFLDFSFFTWMKNFGIITYSNSKDGRVKAKLTAWGRHFLDSIE